jgi:hypothetical protein
MFRPATQNQIDHYDRAVDSVIATCGGDIRGALKALLIANEFLEEELRRTVEEDPEDTARAGSDLQRNVA